MNHCGVQPSSNSTERTIIVFTYAHKRNEEELAIRKKYVPSCVLLYVRTRQLVVKMSIYEKYRRQ